MVEPWVEARRDTSSRMCVNRMASRDLFSPRKSRTELSVMFDDRKHALVEKIQP